MQHYLCWSDDPESPWEAAAHDDEDAAVMYAEHVHASDGEYFGEMVVNVQETSSQVITTFITRIEYEPTIHAKRTEER